MPRSVQRNGKKFPLGEKRRTMSKVELWEQKQKKKDDKNHNKKIVVKILIAKNVQFFRI